MGLRGWKKYWRQWLWLWSSKLSAHVHLCHLSSQALATIPIRCFLLRNHLFHSWLSMFGIIQNTFCCHKGSRLYYCLLLLYTAITTTQTNRSSVLILMRSNMPESAEFKFLLQLWITILWTSFWYFNLLWADCLYCQLDIWQSFSSCLLIPATSTHFLWSTWSTWFVLKLPQLT